MSFVQIQDPYGLAQGISTFGSALGQALQQANTRRFDKEQQKALFRQQSNLAQDQAMRQQELEQLKGRQQQELQKLIFGEKRGLLGTQLEQKEAQERARLERSQQTGTILENLLSGDYEANDLPLLLAQAYAQGGEPSVLEKFGTLGAALERSRPKGAILEKSHDELVDLFTRLGMTPEKASTTAELYESFTTGGKTDFAQHLMEQLIRGNLNGGLFGSPNTLTASDPSNPPSNVEPRQEGYNFPDFNNFEGLTPTETVKRQGELFKENSKLFKENQDALKGRKEAGRSIRQLNNLNDRGNLPKGFGKVIKVNLKTGELRIPSLANAETQLFVKTVNEFVKGAKEQFGARVSNFELDRFMQQLPTLANTEEGRRLILKQMQLVNEISQLELDSVKETFNNYGLRNVDIQQANSVAENMRASKETELTNQLDQVVEENQNYVIRQSAPEGKIAIEIQGQFGFIDPEEREEAIRKGARIL